MEMRFFKFMQTAVLPHLMAFNGVNPHSVLIMDNCSIHHVDAVVKTVHEVGDLVHFLPPDYNLIEEGLRHF